MTKRCLRHGWAHAIEPCPYCEDIRVWGIQPAEPVSPEPEMKSLREIKEKLDRLQQSQDVLRQSTIGLLIEEVRDIADSQGKLYAQVECVVIPVLSSLENRIIELHNSFCGMAGRIDKGFAANGDGISFTRGDLGKLLAANAELQKRMDLAFDILGNVLAKPPRKKATRRKR